MSNGKPLSSPANFGIVAVALITAAAILAWYLLDVVLLAFAGVLGAIFLHAPSDWISRMSGLSYRAGLAIVVLLLAGAAGLFVWLLASSLISEIQQLQESLPRAIERLQQSARDVLGKSAVQHATRQSTEVDWANNLASGAARAFSTGVGALGAVVVVAFVSLFFAAEPGVYRRGVIWLVPERHTKRAGALLAELASTLRRWLAGKLVSMAVVGVFTWAGLSLLGMPVALALAILTALLAFIPNIGPIISVVPPALLAILEGPQQVLYVVLLYLGIQTVESYLLTPLVQRAAVELPPGLILLAQVLLGVLAGGLGVLLATPLTACCLVLVKRIYVDGVLGKQIDSGNNQA